LTLASHFLSQIEETILAPAASEPLLDAINEEKGDSNLGRFQGVRSASDGSLEAKSRAESKDL
jgi:hypothetical protein